MLYLNNTFNGGEMSPQLEARIETDQYKSGARIMENFICKTNGGVYKRPGTEFMAETKDNQLARLEGFRRSVGKNYILEFTEGNIRVWNAGDNAGPILLTSVNYTEFLPTQWTVGASYSANDIVYRASTDLFYQCTQNNVAVSGTEPYVGLSGGNFWNEWTYEMGTIVYTTSAGTDYFYSAVRDVDTFDGGLSSTANWYSLSSNVMDIKTPYTSAEIFDVQTCQINDIMFLAHKDHYPLRLERNSDVDWKLKPVKWDFAPSLDPTESANAVQIQYDMTSWTTSAWAVSTVYGELERVTRTSAPLNFYNAVSAHTSTALTEPGVGANWSSVWVLDTYARGDRVINDNGVLYTCHTPHTPTNSTTQPTGQPGITSGNWSLYWNEGSSPIIIPDWAAKNYVVGDKVKRGKAIFQCIRNHKGEVPIKNSLGNAISGNRPTDGKNWASYWKYSGAGSDLNGINFKMVSTSGEFVPTDVGSQWILTIGPRNYYSRLAVNGGTGIIGPTEPFFIQGAYTVSTNWDSGSAMIGFLALEESLDGVSWKELVSWNNTALQDPNIEHSGEAPTTGAWYRLYGERTSGGQRFIKIEPASSILNLPFTITEYVSPNEVRGDFALPNNQLPPIEALGLATTIYRKPAFSPQTGYPRTVAFHDNRVWWGGIDTEPSRMWASKVDDYYAFLKGTQDTDALDIMNASTTTNNILWAKSYNKQLVIGTDGEIFTVDSGESDTSITSSNIRSRLRLGNGASNIPPVLTGDALLFFQRGKKRLREFAYVYESDSFSAPDMTAFADHISQDGFVQAAFQANLEPVLWAVTKRGALAGFSYDRNQRVTAWHRHITGERLAYLESRTPQNLNPYARGPDRFKSVAVVYGTEDLESDEIWFVVRRMVREAPDADYTPHYYVERFSRDVMKFIYGGNYTDLPETSMWQYLDSYKRSTDFSYNVGTNTYNVSGFDHLSRRPGWFSYDGSKYYIPPALPAETGSKQPGADGSISFTATEWNAGVTGVTFGLRIFSVLMPVRFEIPDQNVGTSMARQMCLNRMSLKLWRSNGGMWQVYDANSRDTTAGAQRFLEILPWDNETGFNAIDYNDFTYSLSTDFPRKANADVLKTYTGQTRMQAVQTTYSFNPIFVFIHNEPLPFNLLGVTWGIDVKGE